MTSVNGLRASSADHVTTTWPILQSHSAVNDIRNRTFEGCWWTELKQTKQKLSNECISVEEDIINENSVHCVVHCNVHQSVQHKVHCTVHKSVHHTVHVSTLQCRVVFEVKSSGGTISRWDDDQQSLGTTIGGTITRPPTNTTLLQCTLKYIPHSTPQCTLHSTSHSTLQCTSKCTLSSVHWSVHWIDWSVHCIVQYTAIQCTPQCTLHSTSNSKTQCTPKCTANRNYSNKSKRWSSGQSAVNNNVEQGRLDAPQPGVARKIGWTRDDDDDDDEPVWTLISFRAKIQQSKIHYSKWKITDYYNDITITEFKR